MISPARPDSPHLHDQVRKFIELIPGTDPAAAVPGCPNWTAHALIVHLGSVWHRVAEGIIAGGTPSVPVPAAPAEEDPIGDLQTWCAERAERVLGELASADPEAPVWQPFPVPGSPGFWRRRLTHETMIHRWDLIAARAGGPEIDAEPDLALVSDGIDEFLEVALARIATAENFVPPPGSLHLHCTDVEGEWWLRWEDSGALTLRREHARGDAAIRGSAAAILLQLWNRPRPERLGAPEVIGDTAVAAAWMALPGL